MWPLLPKYPKAHHSISAIYTLMCCQMKIRTYCHPFSRIQYQLIHPHHSPIDFIFTLQSVVAVSDSTSSSSLCTSSANRNGMYRDKHSTLLFFN
mmetsp:Transcript_19309/g.41923  ORF Transcript_19309/g.41923 Transcript_19309/m.41923 type:complete len:94 (+) Transcript_19309:47-328(+)